MHRNTRKGDLRTPFVRINLAAGAVAGENGSVLVLEIIAVTGLLAVVVFVAATVLFTRSQERREPVGPGQWRATHYEADGVTRVVVQKMSATGVNLLDEHVVAELHRDDADFDSRFLEAMSAARQRQSLFEAEEG